MRLQDFAQPCLMEEAFTCLVFDAQGELHRRREAISAEDSYSRSRTLGAEPSVWMRMTATEQYLDPLPVVHSTVVGPRACYSNALYSYNPYVREPNSEQ